MTDPCWRRPPPEQPSIPEAHFRFGVPGTQFLDFSGPRGSQAEAGDRPSPAMAVVAAESPPNSQVAWGLSESTCGNPFQQFKALKSAVMYYLIRPGGDGNPPLTRLRLSAHCRLRQWDGWDQQQLIVAITPAKCLMPWLNV